jgi:hypothetical protein
LRTREHLTLHEVEKLIETAKSNRQGLRDALMIAPEPTSAAALSRVHDPEYVDAVRKGSPRELAESQGFPWDPALWEMVCTSNGGVMAAAASPKNRTRRGLQKVSSKTPTYKRILKELRSHPRKLLLAGSIVNPFGPTFAALLMLGGNSPGANPSAHRQK